MKRLLLFVTLILFGLSAFSQGTSPLKIIGFHKISSGTLDLKPLKDEIGRDSDFDGNKAALIRVKTQGFNEKTMLDFTLFSRQGMEIIHKKYQNGEMLLYVSSNCKGTIVIKYLGEFEFKLPSELEPQSVYILILGMETATLVIKAVPTEAEIYVDNQKVGTGYASTAVAIGMEHSWKVQSDDYWPKEGSAYFDKQDERTINVNLDPKFGYITINTVPSGANVYIDDIKVGTTPYNMKKIKIGRHAVEVRKEGYASFGDIITIKPGDQNKQFENLTLEKSDIFVEQNVAQLNPTVTPSKKSGVISVSDTKKVYFSCGNLQYQASTGTWRFAEHAWDIRGEDNDNRSESYKGWIDLFYWGKYDNPTKIEPTDNVTDGEWKNYIIANGGDDSWRLLTFDEWHYVFHIRKTASGIRFAKAIVNGINGVVLLPDNWNTQSHFLRNINVIEAQYNSNIISQTDWTNKLEANGAVFLPAAGSYSGTSFAVGAEGDYWTTTRDNYGVIKWSFNDKFMGRSSINYKPALSVRLVCPYEK